MAPPSPLYTKLLSLAHTHASPPHPTALFAIRAPHARHTWGHAHLVAQNPALQDVMDNAALARHLETTGPYIGGMTTRVHDIAVDEHKRIAVVRMSYFLTVKGSEVEAVEQDLVWWLKFTDGGVEDVLVEESVEYVDGAACKRVGGLAREVHGELGGEVRGGFGVREG